jgi:hypothetical protein
MLAILENAGVNSVVQKIGRGPSHPTALQMPLTGGKRKKLSFEN